MRDDADKRPNLGSNKPCGGAAISFYFPSQPGSFIPGNNEGEPGPSDGQPDSQIKISPVSERIKTLEALAARKSNSDIRTDGGFSHFRDRNHEKSPSEKPKSVMEITTATVQKRKGSADKEPPEFPFEVHSQQRDFNEFEETEEWMKAHFPPVPDFDDLRLVKGTLTSDVITKEEETVVELPDAFVAFSCISDAFVDSSFEAPKLNDDLSGTKTHPNVEEESEFDLNFLPTAYVCEHQEKSCVEIPTNLHSPVPPVFTTCSADSKHNWTGGLEANEVGSSGESDDAIIEESASVSFTASDLKNLNDSINTPVSAASDIPTKEKQPASASQNSEKKLIQVPTINVIESDEPNYSEEDMEMEPDTEEDEDDFVKNQNDDAKETPKHEFEESKNEPFKRHSFKKEIIEGYSPSSSPVDSDAEFSPKHQKLSSLPEDVHQESASLPRQTDSKAEPEKSQMSSNNVNDESLLFLTNDDMDIPENCDEWSDETQDVLVKPYNIELLVMEPTSSGQLKGDKESEKSSKEDSPSKSHAILGDTCDRQSEYNASPTLHDSDTGFNIDEEQVLSDPPQIHVGPLDTNTGQAVPEDYVYLEDFTLMKDETFSTVGPNEALCTQDPYSSLHSGTLSQISEQDSNKQMMIDIVESVVGDNSFPGQKIGPEIQQDTVAGHCRPNSNSTDPDNLLHEPAESFVEFIQECLKSRQEDKPDDSHNSCNPGLLSSQFSPTMVMDLEQENLTISALKELCNSQKEDEKVSSFQSNTPYQDKIKPNASVTQSSRTAVPDSPCSQSNLMFDCTNLKEIQDIDEWVAEAYHLAEHVLSGILIRFSGNVTSLWVVSLFSSF
ncbi:ankyrin-2-like [Antennarius striatus]|uniref:ankyrin-2-like n=1 Tax=Antennarius striatus TaxID=241820 RepID=UPI0035AE2219